MTTRGDVFFAFLLGGLIGAGVALLYAPNSGVETRRKIREGVGETGDWAKGTYEGAKTRVDEGIGKVRSMVEERKEDIKAAYEAGKEAFAKGKERLLKESVS